MAGRIRDQAKVSSITGSWYLAVDAVGQPTGMALSFDDLQGSLPDASTSVRGLLTTSNNDKLDSIEQGAQVNLSASATKALYESNIDTNPFDDLAQTKLAGMEAGAQVNDVTTVFGRTGAVTASDGDIDNISFNMQGKNLQRAKILDYEIAGSALVSVSGAVQFDLETSNHFAVTVTGATTFSFVNPGSSGNLSIFTLRIVNGGTNATWPGSVKWAAATAPTLTASGTDFLQFWTDDNGTNWYGGPAGLGFA